MSIKEQINNYANSSAITAKIALLGFILSTLIFNGCAMFSSSQPEIEMEEVSFSFDSGTNSSDHFDRYLMSPGDVLDVLYHVKAWQGQSVFRLEVDNQVAVKFPTMPELNELAVIRPDGNISLPYLGEVQVRGMTVAELTALLKKRYASVLRDPELFVTVPDFRQAIREFKSDLHTAPRGLSRLCTVRPDGRVTFAMIGDIMTTGRTINDVRNELNLRYAKIMPGLSVDLFLEQHSGSRIYILGQVGEPGRYQIDRPITVVEALAMAGSPLRSAKLTSVVVIRRRNEKMVGMRVDARSALHLKQNSFFFYLKPNDVIFVPKTAVSKIGDVAEDIQRMLMFNGWGFSLEVPFNDKYPVESTIRTESISTGAGGTTHTTSTESRETQYEKR